MRYRICWSMVAIAALAILLGGVAEYQRRVWPDIHVHNVYLKIEPGGYAILAVAVFVVAAAALIYRRWVRRPPADPPGPPGVIPGRSPGDLRMRYRIWWSMVAIALIAILLAVLAEYRHLIEPGGFVMGDDIKVEPDGFATLAVAILVVAAAALILRRWVRRR